MIPPAILKVVLGVKGSWVRMCVEEDLSRREDGRDGTWGAVVNLAGSTFRTRVFGPKSVGLQMQRGLCAD